MKINEIHNKEFDISTQHGRLEYYLNQSIESDEAIRLEGLGKFFKGNDPLAEIVHERNGIFALHPTKWESTFYSLTNKDLKKIKLYNPTIIRVPPNSIVADMAIANKFYREEDETSKMKIAQDYKNSIVSYGNDITNLRMPEIIMPLNGKNTNENK